MEANFIQRLPRNLKRLRQKKGGCQAGGHTPRQGRIVHRVGVRCERFDGQAPTAAAKWRGRNSLKPLDRRRLGSEVESGERARPGEQAQPKRSAEPSAPGQVLLGGHRAGKDEHPAQVAHADDEHDEHQRPAAADAEHAVIEADAKRLAVRLATVPARVDEGERRTAPLEAAILQAAELKRPGAARINAPISRLG